MKKILLTIMAIGITAALLGAGTLSFFSDWEISEDNLFEAGELDLKIDCHSTHMRTFPVQGLYADYEVELPIHFEETSLTDEQFFYWHDVKPGDYGEATLSFHVYDNDAWICAHPLDIAEGPGLTPEPEEEFDPDMGELAENIHFYIWIDDGMTEGFQGLEDPGEGDNIWQEDWEEIVFGSPEGGTTMDILYEYEGECEWLGPYEMMGCTTYYIGVSWWVPKDVGNVIQDDWFEFDLEFYAEQHRNNPEFECPCEEQTADVEITKDVEGEVFYFGEPVTYTISACNHGPGTATGLVVNDLLPPGELTYMSHVASPGTTYDDLTGDWTIGELAKDACVTLELTAEIYTVLPGEFTQLALLLDGSGSIIPNDWAIILDGLADAIEAGYVPHDGSVELTVIQFGDPDWSVPLAQVEIGPELLEAGNYMSIAADIRTITQLGLYTPLSCALYLAADTLYNSVHFDPDHPEETRTVINLVTDGNPNCVSNFPSDPYTGHHENENLGKADAELAMAYLVNQLGMDAAQDEFDVEAIGSSIDVTWLLAEMTFPSPGYPAPPFDGPGWVREVEDATEFAETVSEKFEVIFQGIINCAAISTMTSDDPNPDNNGECIEIFPEELIP